MSIDTTHDMYLPDKRAPKETKPYRTRQESRISYRAEAERLYADFLKDQRDADTVMTRLDGPELPSGRLRQVVQRHPNSIIMRLAEMWRDGKFTEAK